jgi:hypothetical protein
MELADRRSLRRAVPPDSSPVASRYDAAGARTTDILGHPRSGYFFDGTGCGLFHLSPAGSKVHCAVAGVAAWRWQRYLVGRVLPFAAVLRGLEPWHASAIALDGSAIALAGAMGSGNSTLAAELTLGGATLLADDVLALEPGAAGVTAHPGPGLMSLRTPTVERLTVAEIRKLGRRVGGDTNAVRLVVAREEQPLPLSIVYLLERVPAAEPTRLTVLEAPDPRLLLGSTFNFVVRSSARLVTQLEVCAAIARSVRVVRVQLPWGVDHRAVAERLLADAASHGAGR